MAPFYCSSTSTSAYVTSGTATTYGTYTTADSNWTYTTADSNWTYTTADSNWSYTTTTSATDTDGRYWVLPTEYVVIHPAVEYTPEQKAAEAKRIRLSEIKMAKEAEERKAAVARAEELLKEHIGLEAYGKLHEVGYIELDSQNHKGRKYRVPNKANPHILVYEGDKLVDELCVHPAIECPESDHILTRIVLLQNAEEHILSKANHHQPQLARIN